MHDDASAEVVPALDLIDPVDDRADASARVVVEDAQAQERALRRHPGDRVEILGLFLFDPRLVARSDDRDRLLLPRTRHRAEDDPGDVRPVSVDVDERLRIVFRSRAEIAVRERRAL